MRILSVLVAAILLFQTCCFSAERSKPHSTLYYSGIGVSLASMGFTWVSMYADNSVLFYCGFPLPLSRFLFMEHKNDENKEIARCLHNRLIRHFSCISSCSIVQFDQKIVDRAKISILGYALSCGLFLLSGENNQKTKKRSINGFNMNYDGERTVLSYNWRY